MGSDWGRGARGRSGEGSLVNQKILFVDDEPAALDLYRKVLQGEFDIATATSGEDGLGSLRNHGPFAIIISDMEMAGMDGGQFLKRVRQLAPNTMRLLLTGHADLNSAAKAVNEGGIFRLLIKPCEKSVLTEAINAALACYDDRREERVRMQLPVRVYRSALRSEGSVGPYGGHFQLRGAPWWP